MRGAPRTGTAATATRAAAIVTARGAATFAVVSAVARGAAQRWGRGREKRISIVQHGRLERLAEEFLDVGARH